MASEEMLLIEIKRFKKIVVLSQKLGVEGCYP
jgi:hypothetical protein